MAGAPLTVGMGGDRRDLHMMYVRGVGNVFEQTVKGDNDLRRAAAVSRGS